LLLGAENAGIADLQPRQQRY